MTEAQASVNEVSKCCARKLYLSAEQIADGDVPLANFRGTQVIANEHPRALLYVNQMLSPSFRQSDSRIWIYLLLQWVTM